MKSRREIFSLKFSSKYITWFILIFILCIAVIVLLLHRQTNNLIQAIAIVSLVLITAYYAIETHKLVEEGQKKRMADFMEKRINDFYMPCIEKMLNLDCLFDQLDITLTSKDQSEAEKKIQEIITLLNFKTYMISNETANIIRDWAFTNYNRDFIPLLKKDRDAVNKLKSEIASIIEILRNEKVDVDSKIRNIYEYSEAGK